MKGPPNLSTREPARVLVMLDQPLVAEIVSFTLNHGVYDTRTATGVEEARALLKNGVRTSPSSIWILGAIRS